jgi:hypothetical protein
MWPVYGGQNGPKSIVSVAPKAALWTPLGLFGQSQKVNSRKYAVSSSPSILMGRDRCFRLFATDCEQMFVATNCGYYLPWGIGPRPSATGKRTTPKQSSKKFAIRAALLLYH